MRIAAAKGDTQELKVIVDKLIGYCNARVPEDLSPETYRLILELSPFEERSLRR